MQTLDARKDGRGDAAAPAGAVPSSSAMGVSPSALDMPAVRGGELEGAGSTWSMALVVPIRTVGGMNVREHWRARVRRVKGERDATAWQLSMCRRPSLPLVVLLTRVGPSNGLDDDNLAGSMKAVRDQIAQWLGVDDRRRDVVRYEYAQERGKEWSVRIEWRAAA